MVKTITCCGYKSDFKNTAGADCAVIPSPSKTDGASLVKMFDGFCGGKLGTAADATVFKTICCK